MNLSTLGAAGVKPSTPDVIAARPRFHIVIAYDEIVGGERGMEMFVRLRREAAGVEDCHCDLWRFDLLGLPGVSEAALLAGMSAQMIIVATQRDLDLPAPVKSWLSQCLSFRPGAKALVALLHSGREGGRSRSPAGAVLEMIARRYGAEFFSPQGANPEGTAGPTIRTLRERLARGNLKLDGILHRRPRPARFGINE